MTEHGRPVAVLGPLGEPESALARLVAAGGVTQPRRDLLELLPPKGRSTTRTSDALLEERVERL